MPDDPYPPEFYKNFYHDEMRKRLEDPKDRTMRYSISVRRPINQDSWSVVIVRAWFDENAKEWRQEYVRDLVWEPYQGFDILDVSKLTFAGPRLDIDVPEVNRVVRASKTGGLRTSA